MQTLGLSDSAPRTESRLKSLFWPSIRSANDLDYLGAQGYWVCAIVAILSFIILAFAGQSLVGVFVLLFYYLSGVGVRERSRYAAACVFIVYVGDALFTRPSIIRVLLAALLLSNLRATWIAARWKPNSEEAVLPPRWGDTWTDKFADRLPMWLWPKVRILYYILSVCYLLFFAAGLVALIRPRIL